MRLKIEALKKLLLTVSLFLMLVSVLTMFPVSAQPGPHLSKLTFKYTRHATRRVQWMTSFPKPKLDKCPHLISPGDVEALVMAGKKLVYTAGGHLASFIFNLRQYSDGYGQSPHSWDKYCLRDPWFRLAITYLTPKDILIGTIFKYIVIRADTVVPPQLGKWYNPNVPTYGFDPALAVQTLLDHGYKFEGGVWKYGPTHPHGLNGTPLGEIYIISPDRFEAPPLYALVVATVAEIHKIGLTNIKYRGLVFEDMPSKHVYPFDFDMLFLPWGGLGPDPDHLWAFFHSSQMGYRGRNLPGTDDPYLDELATIVHKSLDEEEVKDACWEMQMRLMDPNYWYGLCYIPTYSRNFFDAYQPDLEGVLNMPLIGSDNYWTFLNIRWRLGTGPLGNVLRCPLTSVMFSLNPLTARWADEVETLPVGASQGEVMAVVFDRLMHKNPYTLEDVYGMAEYRRIEQYTGPSDFGWVDGMRFTYRLRSGLAWHCGTPFNTTDIKFALDKVAEWQPGLWINAWKDYVGTKMINSTQCEIYYNKTSLWLKDTVETVAAMLPKHIWEGVTDWEHFYPWKEDHPGNIQIPGAPTGHYLKKLCGTGPWIFDYLDYLDPPEEEADLWANPGYWRTQPGVENFLAEMFYWFGDVTRDGKIDSDDQVELGLGWMACYPDPRYIAHQDVDIAPGPNWPDPTPQNDGCINIRDAVTIGLGWHKRKWY